MTLCTLLSSQGSDTPDHQSLDLLVRAYFTDQPCVTVRDELEPRRWKLFVPFSQWFSPERSSSSAEDRSRLRPEALRAFRTFGVTGVYFTCRCPCVQFDVHPGRGALERSAAWPPAVHNVLVADCGSLTWPAETGPPGTWVIACYRQRLGSANGSV